MKRRLQGELDSDSLDLLLDTICNTFGGILLISLLVAVLANMASNSVAIEPPEQVTQAELIELQQKLAQEKEEYRLLQATLNQQREIRNDFASKESIRLANDLQNARRVLAKTTQNNSELLNTTGDVQKRTNRIAIKLDEQQKRLKEVRRNLKLENNELLQQIRKRTREAKLPKVENWSGDIANCFLKNGRLCSLQIPRNGFLTWNTHESKLTQSKGLSVIEPILSAGLKIDTNLKDESRIVAKLNAFDPKKHLIRIWVTPDSFKEFAKLRETLVSENFRYEIKPLPQNQELYLGSSSSRVRAQ